MPTRLEHDLTAFTPDERLPYIVTSSVEFGAEHIRVLRCTAKGHIASGAETFNAPVFDLPIDGFGDASITVTHIITPDENTAAALIAAGSASALSLDNFTTLVRETRMKLNASEREIDPLVPRTVNDAASSAYATGQRLYSLLHRQMPRVQAALAHSRAIK